MTANATPHRCKTCQGHGYLRHTWSNFPVLCHKCGGSGLAGGWKRRKGESA